MSIISPAAAKTDADARNIALSNAHVLNKLGANMRFNRWIRCFAQNLPAIWKEADVLDITKRPSKPAIVIGAGPSLQKFEHLKQFAAHQANFDGYVFCCDKSLKPALAAGVKPDFIINVDSSDECLKFVEGVKPDDSMSLILAATANPSFRAAWNGKTYWFVPDIETCKHQFGVAQVLSEISGKTLLSTGGNAGTTALMAAFSTGARPIVLIGMDMSYDIDEPLSSTPYWNTIQGAMGNAAAFFARRTNPFWKNEYYIDYIFDAYRELFLERANMLKMDVLNCSGQGSLHPNAVHGDAVRCMNFDAFLLKYA